MQTKLFFKVFIVLISSIFLSAVVHAQSSGVAIVNVTAYVKPGVPPIQHATILMRDGRFEKIGKAEDVTVPSSYTVWDGTGKYATAGYWNSHVHFIERKWDHAKEAVRDSLEKYLSDMFLSRGFVYVFDLAQLEFDNLQALRRRIAQHEVKGPTILAVGVPFTSKSPFYIKPLTLPELSTSREVTKHIRQQLSAGAEGIKIWSASPTGTAIDYMPQPLIRKAAQLCRRRGVPLFAHPSNLRGVNIAVDNGVTVLAHVAADDRRVWDDDVVNKMVRRGVALIPTLKLHYWDLRSVGIHPDTTRLVATALGQLEKFHQAGGKVLFGTDVGYMTDADAEEEYVAMHRAGMSFDQILASLTVNPATTFRRQKSSGMIQSGGVADLVVLDKDPSDDPKNFSTVRWTFHRGEILFTKNAAWR